MNASKCHAKITAPTQLALMNALAMISVKWLLKVEIA